MVIIIYAHFLILSRSKGLMYNFFLNAFAIIGYLSVGVMVFMYDLSPSESQWVAIWEQKPKGIKAVLCSLYSYMDNHFINPSDGSALIFFAPAVLVLIWPVSVPILKLAYWIMLWLNKPTTSKQSICGIQ